VSLARTRSQVEFRVRNTGASIPPDELPQMFDRFYRLDPARSAQDASEQAAGYGLGLAIAKDTVTRLGGSIEASSDKDSVTLTIRLKEHI
jgi:OmpR-family two-component system manganese-sensing sensor histidine kinase